MFDSVRDLVCKPDDLSSIPGTHMVETNDPLQVVLWPSHLHTQTNKYKNIQYFQKKKVGVTWGTHPWLTSGLHTHAHTQTSEAQLHFSLHRKYVCCLFVEFQCARCPSFDLTTLIEFSMQWALIFVRWLWRLQLVLHGGKHSETLVRASPASL